MLADGTHKRNAWAARAVAYVRLIPPGAADTIHYRLDVPENAGDTITITARLKYRKFAWWNTQWAFAGVRDPKQPTFALAPGHDDGAWVFTGDTSRVSGQVKTIPDPPVTEMAISRAMLSVLPQGAAPRETHSPSPGNLRERWNDYGIGLLLQGDIRGAEAAFLRVTQIEPGWKGSDIDIKSLETAYDAIAKRADTVRDQAAKALSDLQAVQKLWEKVAAAATQPAKKG
jgi:hypothetical protein